MPAALDARFLDGPRGKVFVLARRPRGTKAGPVPCVLVVPPFAEELNKSRRMFTEVALALAERGVATVFPDLHGTGDSAGEFRDADWQGWLDELRHVADWSRAEGWNLTGLLALRLGCPLAAEFAAGLSTPLQRSVFWQPVTEGERFITQLLRLRVAASMMADQKETVGDLRKRFASGETLEVAGYELSPRLIAQLDRVKLADSLSPKLAQVHWMEVVRNAADPMPPASERFVKSAVERLPSLTSEVVAGEPFWTTTEIVTLPELVTRTVERLAESA